jgi:tetratricopeptide (TPR) repeat protein
MKQLIAFASCCLLGIAQHQHSGETAAKPVALLPGLGIWARPIATRSPEAQKFFDQGLVLLYGFNRPEALRAFRKVLELDSHAAMAHWGVSMAIGPYLNMDMDPDVNVKEACNAARTGLTVDGLAAMDRVWLEAAAARCPDYSDPSKYIDAMRALATRFPDDPDAQTWFAESLLTPVRWHWYDGKGKPAAGVEEAERVLEGVLRRHADHPGANHFYIHAVESSPTPERAVPSAQRLMGIVPAAGHMVHMPGHIWLVLGDYNTTIDVNQRAVQADREYFAKTGVIGSYYAYYLHNLQFVLYARSMQGRAAETRKASAEILEAVGPMAQTMPEMGDIFGLFAIFAQMRIGDWDALVSAPRPKSESPLVQSFWHYSRAMAFAAKTSPPQARAEQKDFETLRIKLDRNMPWDTGKLGDVLDLASLALDARLEATPMAAIPKWRRAIEIQDGLPYDEPPAWYYPLRESLGAATLLSGDAVGAESVFREGLRRSPKNGRMLFGLLESLKAQHKAEAAAWVEREFQSAWKGADIRLRVSDL